MGINKLIFYGPTGKGSPPNKIGGGEKGCLRTIALYKKLGVNTIVVEKPTLHSGKYTFVKDSILTPFTMVLTLIRNPHAPVHIVGFYENQMFYEYLIFKIAQLFRRKTVYELRNGTMVWRLNKHGKLYKKAMRNIVEGSSSVLCQGQEFVDFITKNWNAQKVIYYPNFLMNNFIHPYNEQRAD